MTKYVTMFTEWAINNIGKAIALVGSLSAWLGGVAGYLASAYELLGK